MIHGIDTGFLIAAELIEHSAHQDARNIVARILSSGDQIAIAPQVLAEFMHVATDARRFANPFSTAVAIQTADEVGIKSLLTTDANDFNIFGVFQCIVPTATPGP